MPRCIQTDTLSHARLLSRIKKHAQENAKRTTLEKQLGVNNPVHYLRQTPPLDGVKARRMPGPLNPHQAGEYRRAKLIHNERLQNIVTQLPNLALLVVILFIVYIALTAFPS